MRIDKPRCKIGAFGVIFVFRGKGTDPDDRISVHRDIRVYDLVRKHVDNACVLDDERGFTGARRLNQTCQVSSLHRSPPTAVPSITKPGTLTVCVKAVKSGETDLTCDDVTIEITGSSKTAKLTATGGTYPYDGKAHGVTAKVENGEGYSIEYSKDGKVWYSESPTQTKVGKLTVKVRALKSGAETLTAEATVEVTSSGGSKIVTIVNCKNSVNVRKGASSSTTKIGTAPKGAQYTLLEITGYWYKIQYKKNQTGYVFIDYVKVSDGSPSDDPTPSGDKIVTIVNCSNSVNVRKGGSTSYAKIGTAPKGAKYQYLGKSGDYYKIQYTKSTVGYVHKNYAKVSSIRSRS